MCIGGSGMTTCGMWSSRISWPCSMKCCSKNRCDSGQTVKLPQYGLGTLFRYTTEKAVNPRLYVPSFLSPRRRSPTAFNPSRCPPPLPQPIAFVRIWWDSLIGAPTGIGYFNVMDPFLQGQRFPVPSADSSNEKTGVLLNRSVITAARLNSGKRFFSPCPMV